MSIQELLLRLVLSFFLLLLLTRFMGRKEISQLTFFNFVSAISLGTIGASLAIDQSISIKTGIISLAAWCIFTIFMGYLNLKSQKAQILIEGSPSVVIKKGEILEGELKKVRLDIDSLNEMLRKKNFFSLKDIDYAIFETDGTLSVMKKNEKQTIVKEDFGFYSKPTPIEVPTMIISEGKFSHQNLNELKLTPAWVENELKKQGHDNISEIFYAEIQKDGSIYVDKYKDFSM